MIYPGHAYREAGPVDVTRSIEGNRTFTSPGVTTPLSARRGKVRHPAWRAADAGVAAKPSE
jgi:hypothetical protein